MNTLTVTVMVIDGEFPIEMPQRLWNYLYKTKRISYDERRCDRFGGWLDIPEIIKYIEGFKSNYVNEVR